MKKAVEAAEYCGGETVEAFDGWVRRGSVPATLKGTHRWDRRAIDRALDRCSALFADTAPYINEWLAEHARKADRHQRGDAAGAVVRNDYSHRATGRRSAGEPGSAEFTASFADAEKEVAQARSSGTAEWLLRQYQSSRQWRKLAASTREIRKLNLNACETKWDKIPLVIVNNSASRPGFLRWHETLAEMHPRAADAKLAAVSGTFAWGVDQSHIRHNPIAPFKRAYRSDRADLIWLPEHVAAFEAVAAPEPRLALMLALHTGQRQGDLRGLPWSAYDGAAITLRQGKTRRSVFVPATIALKAALDEAPRRATTILVTAAGTAWAKRRFHELWSEAVKQAKQASRKNCTFTICAARP